MTKFAPHKALKLIARGKSTFDGTVVLHRVGFVVHTKSIVDSWPDPTPQTLKPDRVTSLIRNRHPVGPYSRTMPRLLEGS